MRSKEPASWKSSVRRICDNIVFTIRELKGIAIEAVLLVLELLGLWTILNHHLNSH
jgi:hypothetical protein